LRERHTEREKEERESERVLVREREMEKGERETERDFYTNVSCCLQNMILLIVRM
jgi:hypothetical protein